MKKIVSFCAPSRARPERLLKSIASINNTASGLHGYEIAIRIDEDDEVTLRKLDQIKSIHNVRVVVGKRLNGYESMANFFQDIVSTSNSEWVWVWNDDSLLVGQGWDLKLTEVPMSGFVVQPEFIQLGNGRDINGAFPCVPRNSWAKFGPELIPTYKVDLYLNMIHREKG